MNHPPGHPRPGFAGGGSKGRSVRRVLWLTLGLNLLSASLKLTVGLLSRNLTVVSDAIHSYLDAANNVLGILALKASWRPPDANHPYGHRKYEAVAALAIGGLMGLTSWEVIKAVARRYLDPAPPIPLIDPIFIGLVVAGGAISLGISIYEKRRGRALGSPFLIADAAHTRADVAVTGLSLASLTMAPWLPWLDGVLALGIVAYIMWTAFDIVRANTLVLTDAVAIDEAPIRRVAESVRGVRNCHAIRSHGMPDQVHLDLHIVVAPELTASQTHQIEMAVHRRLLAAFPQVAEVSIHHQTHLPGSDQGDSMRHSLGT